jgi:hypothetical protein
MANSVIIIWCRVEAGAPNELEVTTPRPGICSEAKSEEKHELVKDVPRGPVALSWYSLAETEMYAGLGRSAFTTFINRTDFDDFPNLKAIFEMLRARRAIADGEFGSVPVYAESGGVALSRIDMNNVDVREVIRRSAPVSSCASSVPSVAGMIEESLLCALLVMSAQEVSWEGVLDEWRAAASRMQNPAILTTAVETIKLICSGTPQEIYRKYASNDTERLNQIVGCLQLVVHPESGPAMCYAGLCALVNDVGFATNMMLSHDALAKLARKVWLARIRAPFELRSPRYTVPAIRAACESDKKGLALAATIVLAAGDAVNVKKVESIQAKLQKLAAGTNEKIGVAGQPVELL